jgi:L,D-transpeptidase-like protein
VGPEDAQALLVMRAARDRDGRCWLLVRLPSRPDNARGWVRADRVVLRPTRWRILVSRRTRTLAVYQGGNRRRQFRVVVGAPGTPTPHGLFSIVGVWP